MGPVLEDFSEEGVAEAVKANEQKKKAGDNIAEMLQPANLAGIGKEMVCRILGEWPQEQRPDKRHGRDGNENAGAISVWIVPHLLHFGKIVAKGQDYYPETPPETINFMTSFGSALRGKTRIRSTMMRLAAKLYDCGR